MRAGTEVLQTSFMSRFPSVPGVVRHIDVLFQSEEDLTTQSDPDCQSPILLRQVKLLGANPVGILNFLKKAPVFVLITELQLLQLL